MKKILQIGVAVAVIATLSFTQVTQRTIKTYKVGFTIKNMGLTVNGSLKNPKVNSFIFDKDSLLKSIIDVSIPVSTINTDNKTRDGHLQQEEYFNSAKYPNIRMKSVRFSTSKAGNVLGFFKLTIKGVTKDIKIPVFVTKSSTGTNFKSSFKINRLDYGVGTSSMVLSNDVKVALAFNTSP